MYGCSVGSTTGGGAVDDIMEAMGTYCTYTVCMYTQQHPLVYTFREYTFSACIHVCIARDEAGDALICKTASPFGNINYVMATRLISGGPTLFPNVTAFHELWQARYLSGPRLTRTTCTGGFVCRHEGNVAIPATDSVVTYDAWPTCVHAWFQSQLFLFQL